MTDADAPVVTLSVEADGLAWIIIDSPGEVQNTIGYRFGEELEAVLGRLEADPRVTAAVLASGKPQSFVAGADVSLMQKLSSQAAAEDLVRRAQRAFDRLASLKVPVVAAIRGACLGGGLELALACRARVAADDRKTQLGLPEVQLGLIPAAGGCQRLPRLIGIQAALDLILAGKQVRAKKARALGLVDEVCPPAIVREAAARVARELASGVRRKERRARIGKELGDLALEDNPIGRALIWRKARERVAKKTGGHYPAPLKALDAIRIGIEKGMEAGLAAEARSFGELLTDPVAQNLMGLFFATTSLKKDLGAPAGVAPKDVRKLAVLGGGLMGGGIAYVAAAVAGVPVRLKDKDDEGCARGLAYVRGILDERAKRKSITRLEADRAMALVSATTDPTGFRHADVVIEAVFEDLDLKRRVLEEVEALTGPECVFASNTSTIPISRIAEVARRPEAVLGMHFFSPVHKMPLLEVITTKKTAPWATATAVSLGLRLGKTVIVVNDGPGFYTSRILGPYMNEAAHLLTEGVPIDVVDAALCGWGFPVGPLTLLDEVGIDVAAKAGKVMHEAFADRVAPPPVLKKLIDDGRMGRKNKKGLYTYGKGDKRPDETVYALLGIAPLRRSPPAEEIAERVVLQMINEAARCLGEGILRSPRDGDVGAIFGLGFPPFRGGPFRWMDSQGAAAAVAKLDRLAEQHGRRFGAAELLREHARTGKHFHSG